MAEQWRSPFTDAANREDPAEETTQRSVCRHCGDRIAPDGNGYWSHDYVTRRYYRCQNGTVTYGHNAAHPDVPCTPGGPNPCRCTYAPDASAEPGMPTVTRPIPNDADGPSW